MMRQKGTLNKRKGLRRRKHGTSSECHYINNKGEEFAQVPVSTRKANPSLFILLNIPLGGLGGLLLLFNAILDLVHVRINDRNGGDVHYIAY